MLKVLVSGRVARWRSLKNTGHWQFQCLWHKILRYLHVRYYYHFYTGQGAKIPDSPVKYRISGNPSQWSLVRVNRLVPCAWLLWRFRGVDITITHGHI